MIACGAGTLADKTPSERGERKERSQAPGLFAEAGIMLRALKALVCSQKLCTSAENVQANRQISWNAPAENKANAGKAGPEQVADWGTSSTSERLLCGQAAAATGCAASSTRPSRACQPRRALREGSHTRGLTQRYEQRIDAHSRTATATNPGRCTSPRCRRVLQAPVGVWLHSPGKPDCSAAECNRIS